MGKNGPQRAAKQPPKRGFRPLMRTLAVLALAVQCLVIQTHIDVPGMRAAQASAASATVLSAPDSGQTQHRIGGDCAICQAAAMGRLGLITPTIVLRLEEPVGLPVALSTIAQHAPRIAAHAWQSRAPPTQP